MYLPGRPIKSIIACAQLLCSCASSVFAYSHSLLIIKYRGLGNFGQLCWAIPDTKFFYPVLPQLFDIPPVHGTRIHQIFGRNANYTVSISNFNLFLAKIATRSWPTLSLNFSSCGLKFWIISTSSHWHAMVIHWRLSLFFVCVFAWVLSNCSSICSHD